MIVSDISISYYDKLVFATIEATAVLWLNLSYVKNNVLFTYLRKDLDTTNVLASTANKLEGGINSPLKAFLYVHRGLPKQRMLTAISYWLYANSIDPQPLETFIDSITPHKAQPAPQTSDGPVEIDTAINT
ncbi:hypothetical protein [Arcanobacterium hippocoleae]|uniref:hypothetical protein n=1 Tax=Arcanobacterium hippocoleae TaxID=149017 RepID=UPI0033411BFF